MQERRKEERLRDFNPITVSVLSGAENFSRQGISYKYYENISVDGVGIRGNILLPVDTLLRIDFTLKILNKPVSVIGKVIWGKVIVENTLYEANVEFVDPSRETIEAIREYISLKQKHFHLNLFNKWFDSFAKFNKP